MGDIDLLVREPDLPAAEAMLDALGYRGSKVPDREIVYVLRRGSPSKGFAEHVDNPLKIEVHTSVAEALPVRKVDITARLWPTRPQPGLNAYASRAALLLHVLLRVASNMRAHTLRQIQLHDIAILDSTPRDRPTGTHCSTRHMHAGGCTRRSRSLPVTTPTPCLRTCCASFAPRARRSSALRAIARS